MIFPILAPSSYQKHSLITIVPLSEFQRSLLHIQIVQNWEHCQLISSTVNQQLNSASELRFALVSGQGGVSYVRTSSVQGFFNTSPICVLSLLFVFYIQCEIFVGSESVG